MLVLDPRSPTPPFEQIRSQIADLARTGGLEPGARLPTVRRLAGDLGVAANTVARSYRELERDGVIETRGRHGTFVATSSDATERAAIVEAETYAARIRQLGVAADEGARLAARALGLPG